MTRRALPLPNANFSDLAEPAGKGYVHHLHLTVVLVLVRHHHTNAPPTGSACGWRYLRHLAHAESRVEGMFHRSLLLFYGEQSEKCMAATPRGITFLLLTLHTGTRIARTAFGVVCSGGGGGWMAKDRPPGKGAQ